MKTKITLLAMLITAFSFAQNGINYKAVIKDGLGNVLVNRDITMELHILKGAGWFNAYSESHNTTTDSNGIAIINIGEGTVAYGDPAFNTINWGSDDHFLNMKVNTGSVLTDLGTTQFKAVPYALSAAKAENVSGLEAINEGNGIGWRLKGSNPAYHGNIGLNAVDLSKGISASSGATGVNSVAMGNGSTAIGVWSTAMGASTLASGSISTAMGSNTKASGASSTAMGSNTEASGSSSIAMGFGTKALREYATSMGSYTMASGITSTAMGSYTMASGNYSTAMGNETDASGNSSTAMGHRTNAIGRYSTAMGYYTTASGDYSTAFGNYSTATKTYATAMGLLAKATGISSTAIGGRTEASGDDSLALGRETEAFGENSTAIGYRSKAEGDNSTAIGYVSEATKVWSTAIGFHAVASGKISMALGDNTSAESYGSTAMGRYNIGGGNADSPVAADPLFEIGNGSSITKSNALTVLKKGNVGIGNHMPASLLEVAHKNGLPTPTNVTNAFSIRNIRNPELPNDDESWQFYVDDGGTLLLYRKGAYRGYFNSNSGAYVQASDVRLKKDILPLEASTLQKLMQLNPVSYQMKDQNNEERQIGLISQEVQEVFPSLTHLVPGQDILALSYTELIPILIKAIQEQQTLIDIQKNELQITKENHQSLLSRIKSLETKISN